MELEVAEGIARWVLEETGLDDPPMDARELAALCGLTLLPRVGLLGALADDVIRYDPRLPPRVQQAVICHEIGHWAVRECGEEDTEEAAILVSHALMLPRRAFERDMARTWNVRDLQQRHRNASASWIARRIAQLTSQRPELEEHATATIVDNGQVRERLASSWLPEDARRQPTSRERALVRAVLETGQATRAGRRGWAVPVQSARVSRVVLIAESASIAA